MSISLNFSLTKVTSFPDRTKTFDFGVMHEKTKIMSELRWAYVTKGQNASPKTVIYWWSFVREKTSRKNNNSDSSSLHVLRISTVALSPKNKHFSKVIFFNRNFVPNFFHQGSSKKWNVFQLLCFDNFCIFWKDFQKNSENKIANELTNAKFWVDQNFSQRIRITFL